MIRRCLSAFTLAALIGSAGHFYVHMDDIASCHSKIDNTELPADKVEKFAMSNVCQDLPFPYKGWITPSGFSPSV